MKFKQRQHQYADPLGTRTSLKPFVLLSERNLMKLMRQQDNKIRYIPVKLHLFLYTDTHWGQHMWLSEQRADRRAEKRSTWTWITCWWCCCCCGAQVGLCFKHVIIEIFVLCHITYTHTHTHTHTHTYTRKKRKKGKYCKIVHIKVLIPVFDSILVNYYFFFVTSNQCIYIQ